MKTAARATPGILVIDIGGSHVKCAATDHATAVKFESGPKMTPEWMVARVREITARWRFDVISIGYPGVVSHGAVAREPHNLGPGWVDFDFEAALGRPVRLINDAAMQALGGYEGGKMLFLGLGTGLGSALIVDGALAAMELGHLHYRDGNTYEDYLGERGRKRLGNGKWRQKVAEVVDDLRKAFLPDYILLGGGNAKKLKELPPQTRLGGNTDSFVGGSRLWSGEEHSNRKGGVRIAGR